MPQVQAYAAFSPQGQLGPLQIERRPTGAADVVIDILYCGVCHSDLHFARNEWRFTQYPAVPGHEIVGRVREVGAGVSKHKVGDTVGVGCIVDSCRTCAPCTQGEEQYCDAGSTGTYMGVEKQTGRPTHGGYSKTIVVDQDFVLRIPTGLKPEEAAPLLCAGITTYSPLRYWNVGPGHKVGIAGLGGLGHMGVKLARAMGAHVVLFTTSPAKIADGLKLGAHEVVVSTNAAEMTAHANSFDFILNTVSASHDMEPLAQALRWNGTMCLLGAPEHTSQWPHIFTLILKRRSIAASQVGGIAETQEMLNFCAQHNVAPDIELIRMDEINTAYERMLKSDVRYRFVIDMATL